MRVLWVSGAKPTALVQSWEMAVWFLLFVLYVLLPQVCLKVAATKNEMSAHLCLTKTDLNLSLIHSKKLLFSKLLSQCLKDITHLDPFWDHPCWFHFFPLVSIQPQLAERKMHSPVLFMHFFCCFFFIFQRTCWQPCLNFLKKFQVGHLGAWCESVV